MIGLIIRFSALIIICVLVTACSQGRMSIQKDQLKTSHKISVIPYKASPIPTAFPPFNIYFGGIAGAVIHRELTTDWRQQVVDDLNKTAGTWIPSLIPAEECSKILAASQKVSIAASVIGEIGELPGAEALRKKDPNTFSEYKYYMDWMDNWYDFRKSDLSLVNYRKSSPQSGSDWFLEVYLFTNQYNTNLIEYMLTLKLSDTSNKKLAFGFNRDKYELPVTETRHDFKVLEQNFKAISNKSCTAILMEMGLI